MLYQTINGRTYYSYSHHTTRDRAESALDEYFATDQVCEAERPEIVRIDGRYAVMFPAE